MSPLDAEWGGRGAAPELDPGVRIPGVAFCFQTSWGAPWRKTRGDTGEVSGLQPPGAGAQVLLRFSFSRWGCKIRSRHSGATPQTDAGGKIWSWSSTETPRVDAWGQNWELELQGNAWNWCWGEILGAEALVQHPDAMPRAGAQEEILGLMLGCKIWS